MTGERQLGGLMAQGLWASLRRLFHSGQHGGPWREFEADE